MKLLRQILIIVVICFAGELISKISKFPVPGSVIGMLILFLCLITGIVKLEMIDEISRFLLDHLAFFFIPSGVGIIAYMGILKGSMVQILVICVVSTVVVMVVSGLTVQLLKRRH